MSPAGSLICGCHWFLRRLLYRRPSGRVPPVPPNRPDGPSFLTFVHCLRFYPSSQPNSLPVRGPTTDGIFLPAVCSQSLRGPRPLFRDHASALSLGLSLTLARRRRCRVPYLPTCF